MLINKHNFEDFTDKIFYETSKYGTPESLLLKEINAAGFKPIAICVYACEETFIFKNKKEAENTAKKFLPDGWYYDIIEWLKIYQEEIKRCGGEELARIVYWLDKNYAPKGYIFPDFKNL